MSEKRTYIGKFIKNSWTNMNIRAGKYKHLQTKNKCKCYKNINIEFTRDEFKLWCLNQQEYILSLKKPSIDRIDSTKHYILNNIQIIELSENIRKKKMGNKYLNGSFSKKIRGIRYKNNKWEARIQFNKKQYYLGLFKTKIEALNVFRNKYFEFYKNYPFEI